MTDFSFDERVIHLYNKQRAHPPDVSEQIGTAIMAQVGGDKRVLEIGIGTGRIAKPVAQAGGHVVGFDLSPHMLGEVFGGATSITTGSLHITQADMHHFPFPDNHFDAVMAVHVLHLAKDWQRVLQEVARVLKPDGAFIQGDDWIDPQSVTSRIRNELRMHAVRLDPSMMPPSAGVSKAEVLADLGGSATQEHIAAEWMAEASAAERLAIIEKRLDTESWIFSDEMFAKIYAHLQGFARDNWPDLDAKQAVQRRFVLKITRGRWST